MHHTGSSPLKVYQGRIVSSDVEVFQVRGLATVEFDNSVTYYLDCNTLRNNGSGIMWTRVGGNNPFQVSDVGTGNGRRLSLSGVRDSDLGSYLCYDTLSEDRATINITTGELFHFFTLVECDEWCGVSVGATYNNDSIR